MLREPRFLIIETTKEARARLGLVAIRGARDAHVHMPQLCSRFVWCLSNQSFACSLDIPLMLYERHWISRIWVISVSIFPLGVISSGLVLCGHFYLFETSDPLFAEWLAPGTVAVEGQAPKTFIQVEPEWGEKECFFRRSSTNYWSLHRAYESG